MRKFLMVAVVAVAACGKKEERHRPWIRRARVAPAPAAAAMDRHARDSACAATGATIQ